MRKILLVSILVWVSCALIVPAANHVTAQGDNPTPPPGVILIDYIPLDPETGALATEQRRIMVVPTDGSAPTILGNVTRQNPAGSPDGTQIAFVQADDNGVGQVFLMGPDGSDVRQVTTTPNNKMYPAWSPDGHQIVFMVVLKDHVSSHIWMVDADGQNPVLVTFGQTQDQSPVMSPDGTQIAFNSKRAGTWHTFVMNVDGTNIRRLTALEQSEGGAAWSPDGSRILFFVGDSTSDREIFVMNADGSELRQLTDNDVFDGVPDWSPDGTWIVFSSYRDDPDPTDKVPISHVYLMPLDGSTVIRLTQEPGFFGSSDWWEPAGDE